MTIHNLSRPPKAVIFDTDNTLYPYAGPHETAQQAAEHKASALLGIEPARFREAFREARASVKGRLGATASSHSRLLYFQGAVERLGMRTQLLLTLDLEQTYWRTFLANCVLFPEVQEFLIDLRTAGVTTAIITDLTSQIQFRKIIYFGLESYFDYVVTSEEAGHDKPSRAPFELALEKLALPPADVWMIGDSLRNDIMGAQAFGMVTMQKSHAGVELGSGEDGADVVFDEFSELRMLLGRVTAKAVGTAAR